MGCCRRRRRQQVNTGTSRCKEIEQGGSRLRLWVIAYQGTYRLVMRDPETRQYVDALQFIGQHNCGGPMANMVRAHASRIMEALSQNPAAIRKHAANGASLTTLLKAADAVLKQGGNHVVQAHPTRR